MKLFFTLSAVTAVAAQQCAIPENNTAPIAGAGITSSQTMSKMAIGQNVTLDGSSSVDPEGFPLFYLWEIVEAPEGSQLQTFYGTLDKTYDIKFDQAGTYQLKLTVFDGEFNDAVLLDPIKVDNFHVLEYRDGAFFDDLDYAHGNDTALLVGNRDSTDGNDTIDIQYIQSDLELSTFTLPRVSSPQSIAMSQDGRFLARQTPANGGSEITVFDTEADQVYGPYQTDEDGFLTGIYFGTDGYLFVESGPVGGPYFFQVMDIYNGAIMPYADVPLPPRRVFIDGPGTQIVAFPGTRFYQNNIPDLTQSTRAISSIGIEDGIPVSRGTRTFEPRIIGPLNIECGRLWSGANGRVLINNCGQVFNASDNPDVDMTFKFNLDGIDDFTASASASEDAGLIYTLSPDGGTSLATMVDIYSYETGQMLSRYPLIEQTEAGPVQWYGVRIFASGNDDFVRVIAQDAPAAPSRSAVLTIYKGEYLPQ